MKDVLTSRVGQLNGLVTLWLARIATVALALIAVVTFCDVIARKVFNTGFTFTVEMTEMSMALIVFLGVGLVTHQRGHIVVDVVTLRLSERARVWLGLRHQRPVARLRPDHGLAAVAAGGLHLVERRYDADLEFSAVADRLPDRRGEHFPGYRTGAACARLDRPCGAPGEVGA